VVSPLDLDVVGTGPRLVLAHGFTQTRHSWRALVDRWSSRFETVVVDLPGHGGSAQVHADVVRGAELLGAAGGRGTYVGYSMGGRHALRLAIDRPEVVERVVLIGASPGIADPAEREARADADEQLARHLEHVGVDRFLDEWLAQPLFATLAPADAGIDDRRTNSVAGLAASLRLAGTGGQAPLWDRLGELAMPVLLIVGRLDTKFTDVAEQMRRAIGDNACVVTIDGAGHAVHLEDPGATAEAVNAWFQREGR
jgi:2-succinyl-6-hydroxy-2,4-cyclohexadiene-1-carboxylate synthase